MVCHVDAIGGDSRNLRAPLAVYTLMADSTRDDRSSRPEPLRHAQPPPRERGEGGPDWTGDRRRITGRPAANRLPAIAAMADRLSATLLLLAERVPDTPPRTWGTSGSGKVRSTSHGPPG